MTSSATAPAAGTFSLSLDDFATRAHDQGWPFWRGFTLGALTTGVVVLLPGLVLL